MADINSLPNEVLVLIFHYYHQTELQEGIQQVLSKVCKQWKKVSRNSSLYETVDGSLSLPSLVILAKAGALRRTKTLKFGRGGGDSYKTIYEAMPQLKHLDLTGVCPKFVKKKEYSVFTELDGLCPDFCELVLSGPDAHCNTTINADIFDNILQVRGPNFVKLDFSNVDIPRLQKVFLQIAANCPNLEELFAQNLRGKSITHKFPIDNMQNGCPKLKTLRLGFPISFMKKKKDAFVGFPNLEIFTHPSRDDCNFTSSFLEALLFKSPNLKILDFRGCLYVSYEAVNSLPAVDLEQLHLSFTRIAQNKAVVKLFQKWSHSLNVINMSHVKGEHINEIFQPLHLPGGLPNLEVLHINNTIIKEDTIQIIYEQCPNLRFLNLEACRSLPRGSRNIYHSRSEIKELLLKFDRNKMDCN